MWPVTTKRPISRNGSFHVNSCNPKNSLVGMEKSILGFWYFLKVQLLIFHLSKFEIKMINRNMFFLGFKMITFFGHWKKMSLCWDCPYHNQALKQLSITQRIFSVRHWNFVVVMIDTLLKIGPSFSSNPLFLHSGCYGVLIAPFCAKDNGARFSTLEWTPFFRACNLCYPND